MLNQARNSMLDLPPPTEQDLLDLAFCHPELSISMHPQARAAQVRRRNEGSGSLSRPRLSLTERPVALKPNADNKTFHGRLHQQNFLFKTFF